MTIYRVTWKEDKVMEQWCGTRKEADELAEYLRSDGTPLVQVWPVQVPRGEDGMAAWVNTLVDRAALNEKMRERP